MWVLNATRVPPPHHRYVPAREPNGNPELDQNNYGLNAATWLPAQNFGTATLVQNGSYIDPSGKNVTINRPVKIPLGNR